MRSETSHNSAFRKLIRGFPHPCLGVAATCDRAEHVLIAEGVHSGVNEIELIPHLTLRGKIYPRESGSGSANPLASDSFGFDLGDSSSLTVVDDSVVTANGDQSPLGAAMLGYRQVVYVAADEVELALTEYRNNRQTVDQVESAVKAARRDVDQVRDAMQNDRATAAQLVSAYVILLQNHDNLANARANLGRSAVKLFDLIGGQCQSDQFTDASYYEANPGSAY